MSNESSNPSLPPAPVEAASSIPLALKPLLNPLQSEGPPPSSTIVEPPRSPNPANPAINGNGSALASPTPNGDSDSAAVVDTSLPPLPIDAPVPPSPKASDETPPVLSPNAIPPAVSTPTVITTEDPEAAQLPTPIPDPAPAPAPVSELGIGAEPSLVPTEVSGDSNGDLASAVAGISAEPTPLPSSSVVIPPTLQPDAAVDSAPSSIPPSAVEPVSNGIPEPAQHPSSEPDTILPTPAPSDGMDIDPPTSDMPGLDSSISTQSLKRAGEELVGGDEKRIKDDSPSRPQPIPAQAPITDLPPAPTFAAPAPPVALPASASTASPAPAPALTPGAVPLNTVPINYNPPAPVAAGPTTPLTLTQHKHMLGAVRSLKKTKDGMFFLEPVDPIKFNIPTYPDIIKNPMDLSTVETKLIVSDPRGPPKDKSKMGKWDESKGRYGSVSEIVLDVKQIWWNTARFNGPDHMVTQGAKKLDATFDKMLANIPSEAPAPAPPLPSPGLPITPAAPSPSAHARRPSVSQAPVIRRNSDGTDRPKREIHAPNKELPYSDVQGVRKPKRRNDPQLHWALKTLKGLEGSTKTFDTVAPFLYPVEQIILGVPDYAKLIKKPIDLIQIKQRLTDGEYEDISQVDADLNLMFNNAMKFNASTDPVHFAAQAFQAIWREKSQTMPAKVEQRDTSEDPLADGSIDEESEDDGDDVAIAALERQISDLQAKIEEIRARSSRRKASKSKSKPKKAAARKQSVSKASPGLNGNGHAKKARKSKEAPQFRDDWEEDGGEDALLTLTQKQELAEKIGAADERVLAQALEILKAGGVNSDEGELELDIDSLSSDTQVKLYNFVCKPARKLGSRKPAAMGRKPGRKPGGARKGVNEAEEAQRIARMEAAIANFDGGSRPNMGGGGGGAYEEESESEEEEDSDEE